MGDYTDDADLCSPGETNVHAPLVSCLCVTEERPSFMPWLLWCFDRQTYPRRELLVGGDTLWMRALRARFAAAPPIDVPLFFWLRHHANLSNPAHRLDFPSDAQEVREGVGAGVWADTDQALNALVARLGD